MNVGSPLWKKTRFVPSNFRPRTRRGPLYVGSTTHMTFPAPHIRGSAVPLRGDGSVNTRIGSARSTAP
jgi:hypothetical protein